jgi:propionyl-CoA synthetase
MWPHAQRTSDIADMRTPLPSRQRTAPDALCPDGIFKYVCVHRQYDDSFLFEVIDEQTISKCDPHKLGRIVVKLPLPPGAVSTFWPDDKEKFVKTYFAQFPVGTRMRALCVHHFQSYYDTADAGMQTDEGQVMVMARVDDVINVAGHRLSTGILHALCSVLCSVLCAGALEEAILEHHAVVDCVVVGVNDELKGTVPLAIAVLADGQKRPLTHVRVIVCRRA